jgi:hypothetical protein
MKNFILNQKRKHRQYQQRLLHPANTVHSIKVLYPVQIFKATLN